FVFPNPPVIPEGFSFLELLTVLIVVVWILGFRAARQRRAAWGSQHAGGVGPRSAAVSDGLLTRLGTLWLLLALWASFPVLNAFITYVLIGMSFGVITRQPMGQ